MIGPLLIRMLLLARKMPQLRHLKYFLDRLQRVHFETVTHFFQKIRKILFLLCITNVCSAIENYKQFITPWFIKMGDLIQHFL